jgi:hypothetical protein
MACSQAFQAVAAICICCLEVLFMTACYVVLPLDLLVKGDPGKALGIARIHINFK